MQTERRGPGAERRGEPPPSRRARPWIVSLAITRGPAETIDRLGILSEHEEPEGILLWRLVRDLELWAGTPVENRPGLFTPSAPKERTARLRASTLPPDVRVLIRGLNRVLSGRSDSPLDAGLAGDCAGVSSWAREIHAPETALAFAQAAALNSVDAQYALLTAACAREMGQDARASTWLQRAVGLARRGKDGHAYARSFLALGELTSADRTRRRARLHYLRAFRAARRLRGAGDLRASAAFNLFILARKDGNTDAAGRWAREATRAAMKARIGALEPVFTLADYWIQTGRADQAVRVLSYLRRIRALSSPERFRTAVLYVRAVIGTGDPLRGRRAWDEAWTHGEAQDSGATADLFLQLAGAAAVLKDDVWLSRAGRAALILAPRDEYPRICSELRLIAGARGDFGAAVAGASK